MFHKKKKGFCLVLLHFALPFFNLCFVTQVETAPAPAPRLFINRLVSHLSKKNFPTQSKGLCTDGTYSSCATLLNRLPSVQPSTQPSWRHLWHYISILLIALDTMQSSDQTIVQYKQKLNFIINRLSFSHLTDATAGVYAKPNTWNYQVDREMLLMVHRDLQVFLLPPAEMVVGTAGTESLAPVEDMIQEQVKGTAHMFLALFKYWKAPVSIIQLLARAYMPILYMVHQIHDPSYVMAHDLFYTFYSPLHNQIAEKKAFKELGDKEQFELALTTADCLHSNPSC